MNAVEPDWNLKHRMLENTLLTGCNAVEPDWNLKLEMFKKYVEDQLNAVEPDWNLKRISPQAVKDSLTERSRTRLEFKEEDVYQKAVRDSQRSRTRLEFKDGTYGCC